MIAAIEGFFSKLKGLFVWWTIVSPWERALRVRIGKHVKLLEPGISLKIPGLDLIYKQPIRVRTADIGLQTLTTVDGHTLTLAGNVQYSVEDLEKLYMTIHSPGSSIIDFAASHIADFVINNPKELCTPAAVRHHATQSLNLPQYGLSVGEVNITDFAFVRTFRLIQDDRQYRDGGYFSMDPTSIDPYV